MAVLEPNQLCRDHSDAAIATFEDANLESQVRAALWVDAKEPITCGLVSGLTDLNARARSIESLVGIQNLRSLRYVDLNGNSLTDIGALGGLASLRALGLSTNAITDISVLRELTSLTSLRLSGNPGVSNIQPLLDNPGIHEVSLLGTNVSCADVALLKGNGVLVFSACR